MRGTNWLDVCIGRYPYTSIYSELNEFDKRLIHHRKPVCQGICFRGRLVCFETFFFFFTLATICALWVLSSFKVYIDLIPWWVGRHFGVWWKTIRRSSLMQYTCTRVGPYPGNSQFKGFILPSRWSTSGQTVLICMASPLWFPVRTMHSLAWISAFCILFSLSFSL